MMCDAFSCLVDATGKVTWKLGVDSHAALAVLGGYRDMQLGEFAKAAITPRNGDYLNPSGWSFEWDEGVLPAWCGLREKEACLKAHKQWLRQLNKIIIRHPIVHPFKVKPPAKITTKHINLLKQWADVRARSVKAGVCAALTLDHALLRIPTFTVVISVEHSVRDSVGDSVFSSLQPRVEVGVKVGIRSVWASVRAAGGDTSVVTAISIWDSVAAYTGSFFRIPVWKYVKHSRGKYPYQSLVDLWNLGLVPSFDGTIWRLHGGPKAKALFSIAKEELSKQ